MRCFDRTTPGARGYEVVNPRSAWHRLLIESTDRAFQQLDANANPRPERGNVEILKTDNKWIQNADEALDFEDVPSAIDYCRKHKLSGVQVVVRSEGGTDDLRLRVY